MGKGVGVGIEGQGWWLGRVEGHVNCVCVCVRASSCVCVRTRVILGVHVGVYACQRVCRCAFMYARVNSHVGRHA